MDAPLSRHLTRFSAPPAAAAIVVVEEPVSSPRLDMTIAVYEARLREAMDEARAAALAEAAAAMVEVRTAHEADVAEAVAATAARCAIDAGAAIAAQIAGALGEMRDDLSAQAADALRPLLEQSLVDRAVAAIGETVTRALADPDHPVLTMRGPAAVLASVEARLGATSGVSFAAADGGEIVVIGHGIRIEARLAQALAEIGAIP